MLFTNGRDDSRKKRNESFPLICKKIVQIIEQARGHVAATANYELTMMYWHIGERINREVLGNQRAEYGKQIVAQVARQLTWSHFVEVLPLKDDLAREFYITH